MGFLARLPVVDHDPSGHDRPRTAMVHHHFADRLKLNLPNLAAELELEPSRPRFCASTSRTEWLEQCKAHPHHALFLAHTASQS